MNFWGHNFSKFGSVERICWACGYVISSDQAAEEAKRWICEEEGTELHCGGAWHVFKRVTPQHS